MLSNVVAVILLSSLAAALDICPNIVYSLNVPTAVAVYRRPIMVIVDRRYSLLGVPFRARLGAFFAHSDCRLVESMVASIKRRKKWQQQTRTLASV